MIAKIKNRALIGPKIFRPGNYLDGKKPGLPYRITLSDSNDVINSLNMLEAQNVDFIKIHNLVPRDLYFELIKLAKENKLKV